MASPAVAAVTEGGLTANGTSLAVTLPGSGSATDFYLIIVAKGSVATTLNALTDWAEVVDANTAADLAILYYTGTGVPSNPTFTQASSSRSVWGAYRITGSARTLAPTIGTIATGSSTTPDPPSATVTGGPKDVLAIACFARGGELADDDSLVTTFPTNYTDGQIEKTGTTGGTNLAGILGSAARQVSAASSENPGTFTIQTGAWRAQTIIIYPSTPHTAGPSSTLSLSDARGLGQGKGVADTLALSDAITIAWVQDRAGDVVALSDSLSRVHTAERTVPDTLSLTDNIDPVKSGATDHTRDIDDTLALTDAQTHARGLALGDGVALADSPSPQTGKGVSVDDSLSLSDSLSRVMAYGRTQQDGLNLADSALDAQGLRLGDTLALADALVRARGLELGAGNFGKQAVATFDDAAIAANYKQVNQYANPAAMFATSLVFYVDRVNPAQTQAIRGVIYADLAGSPGALVGATQERVFTPSDTGWQSLMFASPVSLAAGTYWIGFHAGATDAAIWGLIDNVASARKYNADTYSNGPADPFGSVDGTDGFQFSMYVHGAADTLTVADARTFIRAKAIVDSLLLSDEATPQKSGAGTQNVDDSLALTDLLSRVATYARSVTDSVSLTDLFSSEKSKALEVADSVTISDSFFRLATYARQNAESLVLSDVFASAADKPLSLADDVALSDDQVVYNALITVLMDAIATGRIASGMLGSIGRENGRIADTVGGTTDSEDVQGGRIAGAVGGVLEEVT